MGRISGHKNRIETDEYLKKMELSKRRIEQRSGILVDERNTTTFHIMYYDRFIYELEGGTGSEEMGTELAERLLKVAYPYLIEALDREMLKHPGVLQEHLEPTGIKPGKITGTWYAAYRAVPGGEKPGDRGNRDKMVYLINREYIRQRNGEPIAGYAIPAYDVIRDAEKACRKQVLAAMEEEFYKIVEELWGND